MMQSPAQKFLAPILVAVALATAGCGVKSTVRPDETGWSETGLATWYGEALQGHRTASGEVFDYHKLTAAHRTLPFGTYIEVTRVDDGRSVVVKINDRGPFGEGRIIDLSKEAARRIGMIREGVVKVHLRIVREAP